MSNFLQNPKTFIIAIIAGVVPSLVWLWFWLKEDKEDPEPTGLLSMAFIVGMLSVFLVIPLEKFARNIISDETWQIICWAGIEEIVKYLMVLVVIIKTKYLKKPIDWPIFIITTALGFAAFENILFLIKPLTIDQATVSLLTGQLRFLGSTLLHAVSSGIIGISLGLSFFGNRLKKDFYLLIGLISSITLHSAFNFFIMKNDGSDFLKVFAFLWVATIINLLLFEKLRRMSGEN